MDLFYVTPQGQEQTGEGWIQTLRRQVVARHQEELLDFRSYQPVNPAANDVLKGHLVICQRYSSGGCSELGVRLNNLHVSSKCKTLGFYDLKS